MATSTVIISDDINKLHALTIFSKILQFVAKDFEVAKQWIIAVSEWSTVDQPPIDSLSKPAGSDKTQANSTGSGSDAGSITAGSVSGVDSIQEGGSHSVSLVSRHFH